MSVTVACRSTGRGAYTSIVAHSDGVSVQVHGRSGTGNHWEETAEGPIDGIIIVQDISNSGKHGCYARRLDDENVNANVPAGSCICCEEQYSKIL